ncbi:PH domain-containing protein [Nocardioides mesophilus]|uniref:PH domain-containing protein n=1 Tax=Nocardioides mesophilus TaxID=433659 RepID=A0A7G9RDJ1_9ACTN|nr:PH domain-containing protein [Nocardioides mesophilus]QNN53666.1 PH domain-containing protein [Nocardioides mesophilus]
MAFPSRLLIDGEHVVVSTRTHVKALLVPALLLIVLAAAAGFLSALVDAGSAQPLVDVVIWGLALLVALWWVVKPFMRWMTTSYTFTNRRFIKRSGFIAMQGRTIPLNRISGVDFDIGIVDRVFGCGTLVVSDASETGQVLLHDIPQVERVQMLVAEELHRLSEPGALRTDDGS